MEKCILHVQLVDRLVWRSSNAQDSPYCSQFDDRAKCFTIVDTRLFANHPPFLVARQQTIWIILVAKDQFLGSTFTPAGCGTRHHVLFFIKSLYSSFIIVTIWILESLLICVWRWWKRSDDRKMKMAFRHHNSSFTPEFAYDVVWILWGACSGAECVGEVGVEHDEDCVGSGGGWVVGSGVGTREDVDACRSGVRGEDSLVGVNFGRLKMPRLCVRGGGAGSGSQMNWGGSSVGWTSVAYWCAEGNLCS
jgi:hypothetical protein